MVHLENFWKNYRKFIENINNLFYYMVMKLKCRILSIIVTSALFIATLICCIIALNKQKDEIVYADNVCFDGIIGGIELYIDNDLLLSDNMVKVEPSNCTKQPLFTIKKYGDDNETQITNNKYTFDDIGRFILKCKIPSSEKYYVTDTISITVVDSPTDNTYMYIDAKDKLMYVDDVISLTDLATIVAPNNADINISCSKNLQIIDNNIVAINTGSGSVSIVIEYNNIKIHKTFNIVIKPKTVASDIQLRLYYGASVLTNNIMEINSLEYDVAINYMLLNIDNQLVNCWTSDNVVEIISSNPDALIIRPKTCGETIVYVSPLEYENIVFEVIIKVNLD